MRADPWIRTADVWFATMARHVRFRCPHRQYDLRGLAALGGFFRGPECGAQF